MEESQQPRRKMFVEEPIKVRPYDIDFMQIVHNSVYVKWFEDLRNAILDQYFPLEEMLKERNTPILAETYVKYLRPIHLHDQPVGKAWIAELSASRWVAQFELYVHDKLHCEGKQVGYYFNMDTNRPVRFPLSLLHTFEQL